MSKNREVSVILPTYNRADVLARSIESVLSQTFTNLELIVIDSGNDDARAVVEEFKDERIEYYRQEPRGLGAARNFGVEKSNANLIAFQDDDDVWHPEKLAKQMELLDGASDAVGVVYTGLWKVYEEETWYLPGDEVREKKGKLLDQLLDHNFISPQTALVRRKCFDEVGGFDETLPALEDWELWLRIATKYEIEVVNEPLVTAYISPDSMSIDYPSIAEARDNIVWKHEGLFDDESFAKQLFWAGHGLMKAGEVSRGRRDLWYAMITNFRLLYLAGWLSSMFGHIFYTIAYQIVDHSRKRIL